VYLPYSDGFASRLLPHHSYSSPFPSTFTPLSSYITFSLVCSLCVYGMCVLCVLVRIVDVATHTFAARTRTARTRCTPGLRCARAPRTAPLHARTRTRTHCRAHLYAARAHRTTRAARTHAAAAHAHAHARTRTRYARTHALPHARAPPRTLDRFGTQSGGPCAFLYGGSRTGRRLISHEQPGLRELTKVFPQCIPS